jgi:hypothetical protein
MPAVSNSIHRSSFATRGQESEKIAPSIMELIGKINLLPTDKSAPPFVFGTVPGGTPEREHTHLLDAIPLV